MNRALALLIALGFVAQSWGQVLYWVSVRGEAGPHEIRLLDGPNVIMAFDQASEAQGSAWGYRDGATDRAGHMYFGWEGGVRRHDLGTGALDPTFAIDGAAPGGIGTWRALAFDPTGDGGAGSLWTASLGSALAEVDLAGNVLTLFPNAGWLIMGLAYDETDGGLWGQLSDGAVIKIDTETGTIVGGVGWPSAFTPPSGRGLSGLCDGTGRLGAVGGSGPSQAGVYDTGGVMVHGPWGMLGDGVYGIAPVHGSLAVPTIIDHECIDLSAVPAQWVEQAKASFRMAYGHTSHGSQIVSGMNVIKEPPGSLYWWDHDGTLGGLSLWDGTPTGDLGHNGDLTWEQRTRTLLEQAGNDRNAIMWSWCGGCSDNTVAGINTYLSAMNQLEMDYSQVRFVYMTGHLDGGGAEGNLHARNSQIRAYCLAHDKVLFDFADIESYDPDADTYYLELYANDECYYWVEGVRHNWAEEWCALHPGECSTCSCAHSRSLNCDMKGRAFWWMMARMAGWPGPQIELGDLDCDGDVDFDDIDPFVTALGGQAAYEAAFPDCDWLHGDCDEDGDVDFDDINPFVALLGS